VICLPPRQDSRQLVPYAGNLCDVPGQLALGRLPDNNRIFVPFAAALLDNAEECDTLVHYMAADPPVPPTWGGMRANALVRSHRNGYSPTSAERRDTSYGASVFD